MTELDPHQKAAIGQARHLKQDIQRFQDDWQSFQDDRPPLNTIPDLTPAFTWSQLERQLSSLSANPASATMVHDLMSATRKQAPFKPTEMVLREILCIASAVMDETFPASWTLEDPASPDSEEAPMR